MKQSESAAREQWMRDAEREIKAYLAGPPLVLKSGNGEIAAIIARHYVAREEWIPVSERLPEELDRILFVTLEVGGCDEGLHPEIHTGTMYTASGILYAEPEDIDGEFSAALDNIAEERDGAITHWRPLPAPPFAAKGETE